jgi:PAS domain S-box-containing protein
VGRRADQIYESEQKLRTTLTSIGDGVITTDAEGQVEMMNTVAEELTGWTQDQARGQSISDVFHIVNEDSREPVEDPVAKVRRMNRIVGLANHTVLLGRNGTELQIADSGAPIRDKRGRISGVVMVFRDVTMERRTQEALLAQEKLAVAGRLAATIAHEINNPLGSVTDMLYLMRTGVSEREQQQYLDMADGELRRMGEIVRAMLGLYRESHAPIQVDLGATMREILLLTERRFVELGVKLLPDLPAHICVMGFPAELRQVFTNLVTNALEAVGRGGEVRVTVAWETADDGQRPRRGATVTIEDNGPGIPQDVLPQLFQPFFTTKGERGTGLGLWVSRGIISKHSGTLDLRSSIDPENHGTLARVFLPVDSPSLAKSASQI